MADDDDDLDWDEWIAMTDAQREAVEARVMGEYNRWFDGLTLPQQYAHCRRSALRNCLSWRRLMRTFAVTEGFWLEHLRQCQMRLVKLRVWRATGVYPGTA